MKLELCHSIITLGDVRNLNVYEDLCSVNFYFYNFDSDKNGVRYFYYTL